MASSGHGQIKGGVAFGNSGRIYFSGLASGDEGYVKALNSSHQVLWTWAQVTDELPIYNVPALSADGSRLYIGADDGVFYCLDAGTGANLWAYMVPSGTDRRIRSGAAVDWAGPLGPTVYFHCFNGQLYALNATTGALRWSTITGNFQPPAHADHPEPVSSSPVVGPGGAVFVGTTYQGEAYGVTHLGEVVGTIQNDANAYRAFYYTPGAAAVVDLGLTPLATGGTPASQGWTLTVASAISESGVIVGQGIRNGQSKAWILYPQCQE